MKTWFGQKREPKPMPFGKFKGWDLYAVPRWYLCWIREQKWVGAWLIADIDEVLEEDPDGF
jgi:uncharacterized protein (DUF3820 family)